MCVIVSNENVWIVSCDTRDWAIRKGFTTQWRYHFEIETLGM
jgi:hypothetical protein